MSASGQPGPGSRRSVFSFDPGRVIANARKSDTEDLLDRVTVYREGMEPEAVEIIEAELRARGVGQEEIAAHAARHAGEVKVGEDGVAEKCSYCRRPAVARGWGWQRLWNVLPVFPRLFRYCQEHREARRPRFER
jgi:hypothetical protein